MLPRQTFSEINECLTDTLVIRNGKGRHRRAVYRNVHSIIASHSRMSLVAHARTAQRESPIIGKTPEVHIVVSEGNAGRRRQDRRTCRIPITVQHDRRSTRRGSGPGHAPAVYGRLGHGIVIGGRIINTGNGTSTQHRTLLKIIAQIAAVESIG